MIAIFAILNGIAGSQQLPTPSAISDPAQINSLTKPNVQKLTIERLFMTRGLVGTAWSPDSKSIAFNSNISGRYNIRLATAICFLKNFKAPSMPR